MNRIYNKTYKHQERARAGDKKAREQKGGTVFEFVRRDTLLVNPCFFFVFFATRGVEHAWA